MTGRVCPSVMAWGPAWSGPPPPSKGVPDRLESCNTCRALIIAGESGNCTIKVGSTEASTLTVGATCPGLPNAGVRSGGAFVGKLLPPLVVCFGWVFCDEELSQAASSSPRSTITTSAMTGRLREYALVECDIYLSISYPPFSAERDTVGTR